MDYKSRDATWLAKAQDLFGTQSTTGVDSILRSDQKRNLRNLLHRRTKVWWNRMFLQKYLAGNLIPRGLRVQVFPSYPIDDSGFKEQWEDACNICSRKFLELLVGLNTQTLEKIEEEIGVLQSTLIRDWPQNEIDSFNKELDGNFTTWENEIQTIKSRKYHRDQQDALSSRIYRWRQQPLPTLIRTASMSSVASTSAGSSVSTSQRYYYPREARDRKRKMEYDSNRRAPTKKRGNTNKNDNQVSPNKIINLSTHILTEAQCEVLNLGLSFCPTSKFDNFSTVKDLHLFARKLTFKKIFDNARPQTTASTSFDLTCTADQQVTQTLMDLLQEQEMETATSQEGRNCPDYYNKPLTRVS
ncbi:uncharacterized protein LOC130355994 [Hyla sarda]|uniref:uncharacterized protein LOC130355994 n=1 Tax=Hyla sarda TaxID=327740 RepID=UPI0024C21FE4|nr:uncharacterized protein LOC130355994 [Hyla sarda]XP_056412939.1 uncharacterized protein LOC130355994 [Hyla sarda]